MKKTIAILLSIASLTLCACGADDSESKSDSKKKSLSSETGISQRKTEAHNEDEIATEIQTEKKTEPPTERVTECQHSWIEASCTEPQICLICGKIEGSPLGHSWQEATYEAPKTCVECGATEGKPLSKPEAQVFVGSPLPYSVNEEFFSGSPWYSGRITRLDIQTENTNIGKSKIVFSYEGALDSYYEENGSSAMDLYIKIKDESGIVIDSYPFYTPKVKVGEQFKGSEYFYADLEAGHKYYAYLEKN